MSIVGSYRGAGRTYEVHMIWFAALLFAVPAPLVAAVEHAESRGVWSVKSPAGCVGLMQICPRWSPVRPRWLLWLPPVNRIEGARQLAHWHRRAHGDWSRAIAAYRCGNRGLRGKCGRVYARLVLGKALAICPSCANSGIMTSLDGR